jgi:NRAMP (natural resistance-associated macrophage protein)-like metal ion transporter
LAITDYPDAGQVKRPDRPKLADVLGPGLITGASDDDPSGIATYAQAGAVFGFALSWTLLLTYPLMCAIQMISADIGRVTGKGIAANMRRSYSPLVLYALVSLLVLANVMNIGADLGAMGAALQLILPGPQWLYVAAFAVLIVLLEVFMRYASYASVLRCLTLSLFAYVATVIVVGVPWGTVAFHLVVPHVEWTTAYFTIVVAIFGTTISPYLSSGRPRRRPRRSRTTPPQSPFSKRRPMGRGSFSASGSTRSSAWAYPIWSRCSSC